MRHLRRTKLNLIAMLLMQRDVCIYLHKVCITERIFSVKIGLKRKHTNSIVL